MDRVWLILLSSMTQAHHESKAGHTLREFDIFGPMTILSWGKFQVCHASLSLTAV